MLCIDRNGQQSRNNNIIGTNTQVIEAVVY